jgi:L-lactate dehydrogenase complex protein LldG
MNSRDKIMASVAASQPQLAALPDISFLKGTETDLPGRFMNTLTTIGGKVIEVNSIDEIAAYITTNTTKKNRVITTLSELSNGAELILDASLLPGSLQDVELAIIRAHFGVAENGAVWVTENLISQRILPFICQHLAVVLHKKDIVATMHEAYEKIGTEKYGFGTFIAGPSKTADIEQSLVLGAHGARTMTVFLIPG